MTDRLVNDVCGRVGVALMLAGAAGSLGYPYVGLVLAGGWLLLIAISMARG